MNGDFVGLISQGGLASLILEGIKYLIRMIMRNPEFDFAPKFYLVAIPVMNILVIPLLALLEIEGYSMPADWAEFGRMALVTMLASLISIIGYTQAIKPLKEYTVRYNLAKRAKELELKNFTP